MEYKHLGGGITNIKRTKAAKILLGDRVISADCANIVKAQKHRVNLNAWISSGKNVSNVGDYLSYVIVKEMCNMYGIDYEKDISKTKHLFAVGSVLLGYQNATVWGSGFNFHRPSSIIYIIDNYIHRFRHTLDIRAVRGPLTREQLISIGFKCPEVYGDPAILLPLFYKKSATPPKKNNYLIIPHYSKINEPEYKGKENCICSFQSDWRNFVDAILESELIISSSLHGIIIAEAYGIPAIMLKDTPSDDLFKYKDWYMSTGRKWDDIPIADSVENALHIIPSIPNRSTIETIQKNLIGTFPKDLWE